jgi:hypothetical protein
MFVSFERLESRTLFAANAALVADMHQLQVDREHLNVDANQGRATLIVDQHAIALDLAGTTNDPTLVAKLHSDAAAFAQQLQQDRNQLATTIAADRNLVKADVENDDKSQLASDLSKMRSDLSAGLTTAMQDSSSARATLLADVHAIIAARARSSPKLDADRAKLAEDKDTVALTLKADVAKVLFDRNKLIADAHASGA